MQIKLYKNGLFKEHVENYGSDNIDNCVPSCLKCNNAKRSKDMVEWYSNSNIYDIEKFKKIKEWLEIHSVKLL